MFDKRGRISLPLHSKQYNVYECISANKQPNKLSDHLLIKKGANVVVQ